MKCENKTMLLYAVTDRSWIDDGSLVDQGDEAIKGGVTCIQLREKNLSKADFLEEAVVIRQLCKENNIPFFINDDVDIAIKCNADGIHVGQKDMEASHVREMVGDEMVIGVSAQTVEQAIAAQKAGADYLGVGAVFSTTTKLDANAVSYDTLKEICNTVDIPVVAIGGINKNNILELSGTGVDGVALVSAIFGAQNIREECKELKELSNQMTKNKSI